MNNSVERARIAATASNVHPHATGADSPARTPQEYCRHVSMNWIAAIRLYDEGFLSFDPRKTESLAPSQEAELSFLGKLVAAGCCGSLLKTLLAGLKAPYAYNMDRMYFDWGHAKWRLLEDTADIESRLEEWLSELTAWGDLNVLEHVAKLLDDALRVVRSRYAPSEGTVLTGVAAAERE